MTSSKAGPLHGGGIFNSTGPNRPDEIRLLGIHAVLFGTDLGRSDCNVTKMVGTA